MKCPICGKPREDAYAPFCSARCKQVDLGRWFSGSYVVHTNEPCEEEKEGLKENMESGQSDED